MHDERGEYTRNCMRRELSILGVYEERVEYTRSI